MAKITVTNLNDSGAGSLRQALADAEALAGADRIVFAKALSGGTIRLASAIQITSGEVTVDGDIDGNDVPDITISGDTNNDGTGDVSLLNNNAIATFNGIIFDKGRDDGVSAYIISNGTGDSLTISNSYVTDAVLNGTAGFIGTIRNAGNLTVTNVLIENATTNLSGPAAGAAGIASFAGSTTTISRTGVTGTATSADSSYVVLGVNNYGTLSGGILAIGDGDTGEDGTGLVNRSAGTGSVTVGISGTNNADNLDRSAEVTPQAVLGFGGSDTITGAGGNDTLSGGNGADTLTGRGGNDTMLGGAGTDTLKGNNGSDKQKGNAGADMLVGGGGNDTMIGGAGSDTLKGNTGHDEQFGNDGSDLLIGGAGKDTLIGGALADTLKGGTGDDRLTGGDGGDVLEGQGGDDTLTGGAGKDRFVFSTNNGVDVVRDFQVGKDKVVITNGATDFDDLNIAQRKYGAKVSFDGTVVKLKGVTASDLDASDFAFGSAAAARLYDDTGDGVAWWLAWDATL